MKKNKPISPLTRILNSLNNKIELIDEKFIYENYKPFLINRIFATFSDTIIFAQTMDKYPDIDLYLQYSFYYNSVSKKNRFSRWVKVNKSEEFMALSWYYDKMGSDDIRDAIKTNSKKLKKIIELYNISKN